MGPSVLPLFLAMVVLSKTGRVLTQTLAPQGPHGSPQSSTPSSIPTTTPPSSSVFGGGGSIFGRSGSSSGSNTQGSSATSMTSGNVPYDLKDPANPHWRHFLAEVALQTSRDQSELQRNGISDPVIGAMWDVYVQTLSDGTGLPMGGAGPSQNDAYGSSGATGDPYGGGGTGSGATAGDAYKSSGSGGSVSLSADVNFAASSLYGLGWYVTTPAPPTPTFNDKWFLNFFKTPTSSSSSLTGASSSPSSSMSSSSSSSSSSTSSLSHTAPQQTSATLTGLNAQVSGPAYNTMNQQYQTQQLPAYNPFNAMQALFSQFGTSSALQQQSFGSTSNRNSYSTAPTSMMSPTQSNVVHSNSFPTSYQTSAQTSVPSYQTIAQQPPQTLGSPQENPMSLLRLLLQPSNAPSATQQQTSGPNYQTSNTPSTSSQQQQTYSPQTSSQASRSDTSSSAMVADLSRQLTELLGKATSTLLSNPTPSHTSATPSLSDLLSSSARNEPTRTNDQITSTLFPTQAMQAQPRPFLSMPSMGTGSSPSVQPGVYSPAQTSFRSLAMPSLSLQSPGSATSSLTSSVLGSSADPVMPVPRLSPQLTGGAKSQNAIEPPSNTPSRAPAEMNMATGLNPVTFYYDALFKTRASRELGCRTMSEMLDVDVPRPMDLSCTQLCPAIMPGMVTGKRFGTTCLCCPIYVSDQAVGLRGMYHRNRYVAEGLA